MEKLLKNYVKSFSVGYDKFMNSKRFGTFNDYVKTDFVKLNV